MKSRWLTLSLGLNLVLLVTAGGYWAGKIYFGNSTPSVIAPSLPSDGGESRGEEDLKVLGQSLTERHHEPASEFPAPLRWNELESKDYPTYVANLRQAGCPEPVLRRIIAGELKELHAQKAFALVQDFHRDFWEIAARENVRDYFAKTLAPQVKGLCNEPEAILNKLVGKAPRQLPGEPSNSAHPDPTRTMSPDERAEYQLRQSGAAQELQQLYGVDFSENELRNMAKTIDDYHRQTKSQSETEAPADSETLDQKLETVLGPERFADFNRARSASYRELYEMASAFGQPASTAAELFDLRLASEKQSDEIRADKNRPAEEKQVLLDALQDQVEQAFLTKFGAEAYQSYKSRDGRWINSLGRF